MSSGNRQPRPVQYVIRNFGKTRNFPCSLGMLTLTHDQEYTTEDLEFAKFMNVQHMVQVRKKTTGLPI